MSVYNSADFPREAPESVLNQSLSDFEFLVVDDGSTDSSLSILESYARADNRIRIYSRPNRGISASRNELLAKARGRYIAVMDADDIALPNRFELQAEFLESNSEYVCVGGAMEIIDRWSRFLARLSLPEADAVIQELALAGHGSICHPAATVRRSALLEIGGYDESMSVALDLDLWLRLGELGRLANLKDPVIRYRLHGKSISEQKREEQRQSAKAAYERAWQRRGISGSFEAAGMWRPGSDRQSRHKFALKYGWWAFNSAQRRTALSYGIEALKIYPTSAESWKLFLASLLKEMPVREYQ